MHRERGGFEAAGRTVPGASEQLLKGVIGVVALTPMSSASAALGESMFISKSRLWAQG